MPPARRSRPPSRPRGRTARPIRDYIASTPIETVLGTFKVNDRGQQTGYRYVATQWQNGISHVVGDAPSPPVDLAEAEMAVEALRAAGKGPLALAGARTAPLPPADDCYAALQLLVNGLVVGGLLGLVGLGLALIFGVMRIVNFAHGEFITLGAYVTWLIAGGLGLSPLLGLPLALPALGGASAGWCRPG